MSPSIIKRNALTIAGVSGDGNQTGAVWESFMKLSGERPLVNRLSDSGYEIRLYNGDSCEVHVGYAVPRSFDDEAYTTRTLPASAYASFDVFVANGYDSENNAMVEWLEGNREYDERLLGSSHYCVEYYDERFHGDETDSIVEIWVPIQKREN